MRPHMCAPHAHSHTNIHYRVHRDITVYFGMQTLNLQKPAHDFPLVTVSQTCTETEKRFNMIPDSSDLCKPVRFKHTMEPRTHAHTPAAVRTWSEEE